MWPVVRVDTPLITGVFRSSQMRETWIDRVFDQMMIWLFMPTAIVICLLMCIGFWVVVIRVCLGYTVIGGHY